MARRNQFKVDAESVQGNEGAWIECKAMSIGAFREWMADDKKSDLDLVSEYVLAWGGLVDDDGNEIPNIADEPDAINLLYWHEIHAIGAFVIRGPLNSKN